MLNPIAFSIGPVPVHWYGIIIGVGALLGLMLVIREGKRFGIEKDFFYDLLLIGFPSAIVGARIYYVAFEWDSYKNNIAEIFMIWHGGIAIYGALIGAVIAAVIYTRAKGYSFWRIADICAPGLITGQMIGRWGNFVNQEAHGGPVSQEFLSSTLKLPSFIVKQMYIDGQYYHPTFLYESVWSLTGLILLLILRRRKFLKSGELFMGYFIWYSLGRFYVEGVRTDSLSFAGPDWLAALLKALWSPAAFLGWGTMQAGENIRTSQLLAVLILLAATALIIVRRIRKTAVPYSSEIERKKGTKGIAK
ncbi:MULTISPECIES: prolipoprotein diacylglyceryl transferase [unclassified Paenibacillus]|uniref:prolipoprotein diacylglyceryl transferase n=1 Tax=unclassified Paenibacillus TaxID=185978 RepID=UPI0024053DE7|nr:MULTISPECIES: prolipoprotein diacylglyceryl transferase [unclassified Paenibacillus]MDF9842609.1 phosphatidylglycerol:prolipoprotein diacylglycerol transferase [Paenibacillus sp. PastF-2]MDF9849184.1 phosphatidylglycerol:prolipoprotein diacylglycerol transferase [Paenibacillus sp. PastM-2]MDF9855770.1 phosphatidylglycerol:prolipoprotein diacylglycerol transferase [Paenibacillus sp. PastF-1]MDH6481026.1 phosphatidylglycerol:prolipoprotein diacylglycerol transferase [Paenibacillus sp. PastH-2]